MTDAEREQLRLLALKWIAQARHPMRVNRTEERDLLQRCATQLLDVIARPSLEVAGQEDSA